MRKGTRGTQGPWTKVGHVAMGCQPACRDEKQPVAEMFALLAAFLARITRTQTCHVWRRFMVWSCTHQLRPVDIARQYFGVCGSGSTTAASASDTPLVCVDYPRSDGIPRLCPHHHPGRVGRVLPDVRAPGRGGRGEPRTRTRPSPTASPGSSGRESRLDTCVMGAGPAGPAVVKASAERNLPHAHLEWHAGPGGGMGISTAPAARCARPPSRCGRSGGCGRGCGSGNVRPGPALSGLRRPAESRRHGGGPGAPESLQPPWRHHRLRNERTPRLHRPVPFGLRGTGRTRSSSPGRRPPPPVQPAQLGMDTRHPVGVPGGDVQHGDPVGQGVVGGPGGRRGPSCRPTRSRRNTGRGHSAARR